MVKVLQVQCSGRGEESLTSHVMSKLVNQMKKVSLRHKKCDRGLDRPVTSVLPPFRPAASSDLTTGKD